MLHATALPGNPYDGRTLGPVVSATERLTGCAIERGYLDKGYRGHNAAKPRCFFLSGQRRVCSASLNANSGGAPLSGPLSGT